MDSPKSQKSPRKKMGRPPKLSSKTPASIEEKENRKFSFKDQLTVKELTFLELYLSGNLTQVKAMDLAGYGHMNHRYKQTLAAKIIRKYESQAEDHRSIFRAIGCGQVRVAKKINKAMDKAKSEMVQYNYTHLAAKALGITQDIVQGSQGLTLIVASGDGSPTQINVNTQTPEPTPQNDGFTHPTPSQQGKPLVITK